MIVSTIRPTPGVEVRDSSSNSKANNNSSSSLLRSGECLRLISRYSIPQSKKFEVKPEQNSQTEITTEDRKKRMYWTDEDFNLLRAQSLLKYSRKRMAQLLKRDDRLIFSKLQKHGNNLIEV